MKVIKALSLLLVLYGPAYGQEYHVSSGGDDNNTGTSDQPFKTISKAAEVVQPGSTVTVHEGVYRELINPPRGGTSDRMRIVYHAAEGEHVVIKGSEVMKGWKHFIGDVWKLIIPNTYFGEYNPYKELISGDWFYDHGRIHHTGEVYLNGKSLFEAERLERVLNPKPFEMAYDLEGSTYTWYCESDEENTYIYANFHGINPNESTVEINVRKACFYPEQTGIDYITLRGFNMCQAATQWAPPTAEQVGLIGTNWSKGWIIEHNTIHDSKCSGITLGKDRASGHNIWSGNRCIDGATHYNNLILKVIEEHGWSKENIGSHIVRNNIIHDCEQAGICGSMGCAFSIIENNHIHHIWVKRQFGGAEIAGIKFHGNIDGIIRNNRINDCLKGIWLDWMTQGTRVTGNLIYNSYNEDIFVEVNHGSFVIDHNLLLSRRMSILDTSEGGAYINNLFAGALIYIPQDRTTPYQKPHSTEVIATSTTICGDNRYYNNIFSAFDVENDLPDAWWIQEGNFARNGFGIAGYDSAGYPSFADGNVYYNGALKSDGEENYIDRPDFNPGIRVEERAGGVYLHIVLDESIKKVKNKIITGKLLGQARVTRMGYENPDGSPVILDIDYFGHKRNMDNPFPGPFEDPGTGALVLKVW